MQNRRQIYIGTSGWSYPKGEGTWKGYFYPAAGKFNELEFYSQFFNTVEVNSSFYRPPNPGFVANWARHTPKDFKFAVKLWQKFTHPLMYEAATGEKAVISPSDVDLFLSSIKPLEAAGKLGAVLAQFPPSFTNDRDGQRLLQAVIRTFGHYQLAVELRHRSWSDDPGTAGMMRQSHVCWVQIDEPKFGFSVAAEVPLTSDMAYFRFHGRNAETWWLGNNETRYKYLYSPEEIAELSGKVAQAAGKANLTFAFFNNHWQAWAPRNAVGMIRALQLPFRDFPMLEKPDEEK